MWSDQNVCGFKIPVHQVMLMQKSGCFQYLIKQMQLLQQRQSTSRFIEREPFYILHNKIGCFSLFAQRINRGNARMAQFGQSPSLFQKAMAQRGICGESWKEDLEGFNREPIGPPPQRDVLGRAQVLRSFLLCFDAYRLYAFPQKGGYRS